MYKYINKKGGISYFLQLQLEHLKLAEIILKMAYFLSSLVAICNFAVKL